MMNKFFLFSSLLLFMSVSLIITSCGVKNTPTPVVRDFSILDLFIGLPDMPNGWRIKMEPEHIREVGTFEAATVSFISDINITRNGASQGVYNYGTLEDAKLVFHRIYEPRVHGNQTPGWNNPQISANQYKLGCYDWEGREPYSCTWVAQYEEFIVQFDTWIIPGYMSFNDVENITVSIDDKMKSFLGMITTTPTE